jgi:hypothetical protein
MEELTRQEQVHRSMVFATKRPTMPPRPQIEHPVVPEPVEKKVVVPPTKVVTPPTKEKQSVKEE